MKISDLFYSFRIRLLLVLATLLVVTLGVQYFIFFRLNQDAARIIAEQEQALAISIALALESVSSTERLNELYKQQKLPLLEEQAGRVINILVVSANGFINDSLDPKYNPERLEDGTDKYFRLTDVVELPPLVDAGRSTADIAALLGGTYKRTQPQIGAGRAFPIRLQTNDGTPNYIIVILGSANTPVGVAPLQAARPLLPTLVVLLTATLATGLLVWRFTRPIQDLSEAARRAAHGDFTYRVPVKRQRDEMGRLALVFNRMNARLGQMRDLEAQLHHVERSALVGRLASAIAHEIRNPLNYINLTLDHLRTSFAPEDAGKRTTFLRLADNLKTEVARINTRISEFLKYTRPSRLELQPLDLRYEIEDALRIVEAQAAETGVELKIEQHGDVPPVLGDRESLRSVFTNLIINGMQAIDGRGGQLTIELSSRDHTAQVRVSDTGGGIAPENLSQIFEAYFSTKETGTGLGLAIVKKAIDDHGGSVEVESRPGAGTTFTINLPLAEEIRGRRSVEESK